MDSVFLVGYILWVSPRELCRLWSSGWEYADGIAESERC